MKHLHVKCVAACLTALLPCAVLAAAPPPGTAAMTIAIDPVTGEKRPATAEELAALHGLEPETSDAAASSTAASAWHSAPFTSAEAVAGTRRLRDGTQAMKMPRSAMPLLHASVDANGNVSIQHADGGQEPQNAAQGDMP